MTDVGKKRRARALLRGVFFFFFFFVLLFRNNFNGIIDNTTSDGNLLFSYVRIISMNHANASRNRLLFRYGGLDAFTSSRLTRPRWQTLLYFLLLRNIFLFFLFLFFGCRSRKKSSRPRIVAKRKTSLLRVWCAKLLILILISRRNDTSISGQTIHRCSPMSNNDKASIPWLVEPASNSCDINRSFVVNN